MIPRNSRPLVAQTQVHNTDTETQSQTRTQIQQTDTDADTEVHVQRQNKKHRHSGRGLGRDRGGDGHEHKSFRGGPARDNTARKTRNYYRYRSRWGTAQHKSPRATNSHAACDGRASTHSSRPPAHPPTTTSPTSVVENKTKMNENLKKAKYEQTSKQKSINKQQAERHSPPKEQATTPPPLPPSPKSNQSKKQKETNTTISVTHTEHQRLTYSSTYYIMPSTIIPRRACESS